MKKMSLLMFTLLAVTGFTNYASGQEGNPPSRANSPLPEATKQLNSKTTVSSTGETSPKVAQPVNDSTLQISNEKTALKSISDQPVSLDSTDESKWKMPADKNKSILGVLFIIAAGNQYVRYINGDPIFFDKAEIDEDDNRWVTFDSSLLGSCGVNAWGKNYSMAHWRTLMYGAMGTLAYKIYTS